MLAKWLLQGKGEAFKKYLLGRNVVSTCKIINKTFRDRYWGLNFQAEDHKSKTVSH